MNFGRPETSSLNLEIMTGQEKCCKLFYETRAIRAAVKREIFKGQIAF